MTEQRTTCPKCGAETEIIRISTEEWECCTECSHDVKVRDVPVSEMFVVETDGKLTICPVCGIGYIGVDGYCNYCV